MRSAPAGSGPPPVSGIAYWRDPPRAPDARSAADEQHLRGSSRGTDGTPVIHSA
jgi:hypothetical protein